MANLWFYAFIGLFIILIGGTLNVMVMDANDCEMPIRISGGIPMYNQACYLPFEDFQEVNLPILADIIDIKTGRYIHHVSIGDILAVSGGLCLIYILVLIAVQHNKTQRENILKVK
jgi:hypothetical protein